MSIVWVSGTDMADNTGINGDDLDDEALDRASGGKFCSGGKCAAGTVSMLRPGLWDR